MPIPEHELEKSFLVVNGNTTVAELRTRTQQIPEPVRYLAVELGPDSYSVVLLSEVAQAIDKLGPATLDWPLYRLPHVAEPAGAVQRTAIGFGEAERVRDRLPRRRLVVLEGSRPLGLLTNEARGASAGGLPFTLFGPYITLNNDELREALVTSHKERMCPSCGKGFTFFELRADLGAYACPHCHRVLEVS